MRFCGKLGACDLWPCLLPLIWTAYCDMLCSKDVRLNRKADQRSVEQIMDEWMEERLSKLDHLAGERTNELKGNGASGVRVEGGEEGRKPMWDGCTEKLRSERLSPTQTKDDFFWLESWFGETDSQIRTDRSLSSNFPLPSNSPRPLLDNAAWSTAKLACKITSQTASRVIHSCRYLAMARHSAGGPASPLGAIKRVAKLADEVYRLYWRVHRLGSSEKGESHCYNFSQLLDVWLGSSEKVDKGYPRLAISSSGQKEKTFLLTIFFNVDTVL